MEMRAQLEKKLAQKEKEKKEEHLRQLAQKAREERAGIRTTATTGKQWLFEKLYPLILNWFIRMSKITQTHETA